MAQSQYGTIAQLQTLCITQAAATRFGTSAMDAALQAASSICDAYLPSQFTLPLVTWDMSLTLAACAIAAQVLYNTIGFPPNAPGDELINKRAAAAYLFLEQVRDEKTFPQWTDSSGQDPIDEPGDYVVSDAPAGFTDRGILNTVDLAEWWPG